MSDQTERDNPPSALVWENATSPNGDTYKVGRDKAEVQKGQEASSEGADSSADFKTEFTIAVDWPVGNKTWKLTTEDVKQKAAITRYRLFKIEPRREFAYRLEFSNLERYNYFFTDGEGDNYSNNTWLNSDHYIQYNSEIPKITSIKGS